MTDATERLVAEIERLAIERYVIALRERIHAQVYADSWTERRVKAHILHLITVPEARPDVGPRARPGTSDLASVTAVERSTAPKGELTG